MDADFVRHVCSQIDEYIRSTGISDAEAARVLGVRKQMIKPYRRGLSLPGTQALARACVHWNLRFSYQGAEISATTIQPNIGPTIVPQQLNLPFGIPLEFRGKSAGVPEILLTMTFERAS